MVPRADKGQANTITVLHEEAGFSIEPWRGVKLIKNLFRTNRVSLALSAQTSIKKMALRLLRDGCIYQEEYLRQDQVAIYLDHVQRT